MLCCLRTAIYGRRRAELQWLATIAHHCGQSWTAQAQIHRYLTGPELCHMTSVLVLMASQQDCTVLGLSAVHVLAHVAEHKQARSSQAPDTLWVAAMQEVESVQSLPARWALAASPAQRTWLYQMSAPAMATPMLCTRSPITCRTAPRRFMLSCSPSLPWE